MIKRIVIIISLTIILFSCKSTSENEEYPCPVYNTDLQNISNITETDSLGNLIGNIDDDDWYFQLNGKNIINRPVFITDFTVTLEIDVITINWNTQSETNINHYDVRRSDYEDFSDPTLINPSPIEATNTLEPHSYTLFDETGFSYDHTYYYRIDVTENSDEISHSEAFILNIPPENIYMFGPAYPNPAISEIKIPYAVKSTCHVTIIIIDSEGKLITTLVNKNETAGRHETTWNAPESFSGIYRCIFHINDQLHWHGDIRIN